MECKLSRENGQIVLELSGRFDLKASSDFRQVEHEILRENNVESVLIGLGNVNYIDSTAMGLLIAARSKIDAKFGVKLALTQPKGMVKKSIEMMNLHRVFRIYEN